MARSKHSRDHMSSGDEAYLYRGSVPETLAEKFIEGPCKKRILCLKGFMCSGKTRTAKECARTVQVKLEERQEPQEVHTFFFNLKSYKTLANLKQAIVRNLKEHVSGWETLKCADTEFYPAFKTIPNGCERTYLFVFDDVDSMRDEEHTNIQTFIDVIIKETKNVHIFLTSKEKICFVRNPDMVLEHDMTPMEPGDAKKLLMDACGDLPELCKKVSDDPGELKDYADEILVLVGRLPLALMIAGYEMNSRRVLAYTPPEMVELLSLSTSQMLNPDNAPEEDKLSDRIEQGASSYYHVLEKIFFAVDNPESFDVNELYSSLDGLSPGYIKQSILRVLLDGSLCTILRSADQEHRVKTSPMLMKIFHEAFCQISQKDSFLKEFNTELKSVIPDCKVLYHSTPKVDKIKQAERCLLTQQKFSTCTKEQKRELRKKIVTHSMEFLQDVVENVERTKFKKFALQLIKTIESEETQEYSESGVHHRPEPEAALSPPFHSVLPSKIPHITPMNTHPKNPGTTSNDQKLSHPGGSNMEGDPQKGNQGPCENVGNRVQKTKQTVITEDGSGSQKQCPSHITDYASSGPSNLLKDDMTTLGNLAEGLQVSLNLDGNPRSMESTEREGPSPETCNTEEEVSNSNQTYSVLSTLPDEQVLNHQNNPNTKIEEAQGATASLGRDKSREAVESEYDWEKVDGKAQNAAEENKLPIQVTLEERKPVQVTDAGSASPVSRSREENHTKPQKQTSQQPKKNRRSCSNHWTGEAVGSQWSMNSSIRPLVTNGYEIYQDNSAFNTAQQPGQDLSNLSGYQPLRSGYQSDHGRDQSWPNRFQSPQSSDQANQDWHHPPQSAFQPQQSYPRHQLGYHSSSRGNHRSQNPYQSSQRDYTPRQQGNNSRQVWYPPRHGWCPPHGTHQGQNAPQQSQYRPRQDQYPPLQDQYPPFQGRSPPLQGQYSPEQGQYLPVHVQGRYQQHRGDFQQRGGSQSRGYRGYPSNDWSNRQGRR